MSEYTDLLNSVANTVTDYRAEEIPVPTTDHVERWINQFDQAVKLPLLHEIDHVFKNVAHPVPWTQVCLTRRA